jgi:Kdo2-lipid IVA lauroyltransferase/acyltransferase
MAYIPRIWSIRIANLLGSIWYFLDKRHRIIALKNIKLAYGFEKTDHEREQLTRSVFKNIALIPFEIGWSLRLRGQEILEHFEIQGLDNLISALEKGKGALVLTAHTGNWEFLTALGRYIGSPLNIIYNPIKQTALDDFVYKYRTRFGAKMIPKKRSLRKVVTSLKNNECVAILLDQNPRRQNGIFVDYFSKPTLTSKGLAFLALKTKSPVIPVFIARKDKKFLVEIGEELPLVNTSDFENDLYTNTEQYNKCIEHFVRRYPEQWFWVHRRWKNTLSFNKNFKGTS